MKNLEINEKLCSKKEPRRLQKASFAIGFALTSMFGLTACGSNDIPKKEDIVPITERKELSFDDITELESPFTGKMTEEESEKVEIGKKYDKMPVREIVDKKNAEVMYYYRAYEYIDSEQKYIAVPEADQLFYRKDTTNMGGIPEIPNKTFVYILDGYYVVEAHYEKNEAGEYEKKIVYENFYTKVKKIEPTMLLYEKVPKLRSDEELKKELGYQKSFEMTRI